MVDSGQSRIAAVSFGGQRHADLPVEVLDRSELIERVGAASFATPQRPSFFLILLGRSGTGTHRVDFESVPVQPGRLIQVRPGQVQLWDSSSRFEASVVLARASVAPGELWFPGDRVHRDLGEGSLATAESLVEALGREQDRFEGADSSVRLMNALFMALLALFDHADPDPVGVSRPEAYVAFRSAVESDVSRGRNVRDYVSELGFSERTVNRACRQVTGRSAKALLDERLVLEAKRLLAHTSLPASGVAAVLGFSEATNFHKFFARHTGQRPGGFREDLRAAGYEITDHTD